MPPVLSLIPGAEVRRSFTLDAPIPVTGETPHYLVRPDETAVYRFYDADQLLYVGVTWNPYRRWCSHRRRTKWFKLATRVDVSVFADEATALRIEREWIRTARPLWNIRSAAR